MDTAKMMLGVALVCSAIAGCRPEPVTRPPAQGASGGEDPVKAESSARVTTRPSAGKPEGQEPSDGEENSVAISFEDVAELWGCRSVYRNGEQGRHFAMIENIGGGVAVSDFDRDGQPDLYFAGGGRISPGRQITGLPTRLYQQRDQSLAEVTTPAGIPTPAFYAHGLVVFDADNDGFEDVLVTGYGGLQFSRNNGDGTFSVQRDDELSNLTGWFTSGAAGDFDRDGILDLYLCRYVDWSWKNNPPCFTPDKQSRELCSPLDFQGQDDVLLRATGNGGWRNVTEESGLAKLGKGLGAIAADLDDDHDTDLYVANDTTDNFLYLNDGAGKLVECAMVRGAAVDERALPNGSMGLSVCDINDDLQTDLWVTNYELEAFAIYRNEGAATFLHTSRRYGIAALGGMYVGFGTDWQDFDLDGADEIVVTNGHVLRRPVAAPRLQSPLLLTREGSRYLRQTPKQSPYFQGVYEGRGLASGDLNQDGLVDLVITHLNTPAAVLINRSIRSGKALQIRLIGTDSNRDAIGSRVVLETSRGERLKHIVGGGSYLSKCDLTVTFGLRPDEVARSVTVYWPNGQVQVIEDRPISEYLLILEADDDGKR